MVVLRLLRPVALPLAVALALAATAWSSTAKVKTQTETRTTLKLYNDKGAWTPFFKDLGTLAKQQIGLGVPLAAFMMRSFFTGIAYSLYEAAILDGASAWKVFWRIYLPLSLAALAAIFILEFTVIWNELLLGLTLTQTAGVRPIMASLTTLQSAYSGTTVPVILAAGLLVSLPTVAMFLATQRLFARGLSLGQL